MATEPFDQYLVAIIQCPDIGSRTLEKLFNHFPSAKDIWLAKEDQFKNLGITEKRLASFFKFRQQNSLSYFAEEMHKHQLRLITKDNPEYPPLLKNIFDPPYALFIKGALLKNPFVAIVGSRQSTPYGNQTARHFSKELSINNISIVSGLASGIDTNAHLGAIENHSKTIAILGGGLLTKNSLDKKQLTESILTNNGAIISEFGLFAPFLKHHFPLRNRIIAGMSNLTLIIEANLPSGSLITAKSALENGREVFAVPGPINSPTSAGTNQLIKDGAGVATSPDDILLALQITNPTKSDDIKNQQLPTKVLPNNLNTLQKKICDLLHTEPMLVDELAEKTNSSPIEIGQNLSELEIIGLVAQLGGSRYKRL